MPFMHAGRGSQCTSHVCLTLSCACVCHACQLRGWGRRRRTEKHCPGSLVLLACPLHCSPLLGGAPGQLWRVREPGAGPRGAAVPGGVRQAGMAEADGDMRAGIVAVMHYRCAGADLHASCSRSRDASVHPDSYLLQSPIPGRNTCCRRGRG